MSGKIYKIYCEENENEKVYIGSTFRPLNIRLSEHKHRARKNSPIYGKSSSHILFDNYTDVKISCLEEIENITRDELRRREKHYLSLNRNNVVNKLI